jgi:hypothetical protein
MLMILMIPGARDDYSGQVQSAALNTRFARHRLPAFLILLAVFLAPQLFAQNPTPPTNDQAAVRAPLPKGKKLILNDGTFLLVREYQTQGDRLRYYSVERSQWEGIPVSFVNWEATKKAEAEEAARDQALVEKIQAREAVEHAQPVEIDASIEAAPGVFLPPGEGVYVLDGKAMLPLEQAEAGMKRSKGRLLEQVLIPIPVVPSRQNVTLKGAHAKFRINNRQVEFFMRTADAQEPKMDLIRASVHGDSRLIENLDTYFTARSEKRKSVPLQTWQVAKRVYRFTLGQPLEPGEYALAEIVEGEGLNLLVWDFGVDAAANKKPSK